MKRWVKFIQSFLTMLKVCDDVDKRKSRYATWRKLYGFKNIKLETHRTVFLFPTKPKHTKNPRFYPILQLLTVECLRINNYILRCNTRILINILTFFIHVALEETRDIYSITLYNYIYTPLRKPASMWPIHVLVFT